MIELRVYRSIDRLRYDFRLKVEEIVGDDSVKVIKDREIVVGKYRMVFMVDDYHLIRGIRPDKVFIDEGVSRETGDYLNIIVK